MKPKTLPTLVEHTGTGFLMPEETARRIEELSRGLPGDFNYRRRARAAAELVLNAGERTDISTVTTDALDRERECILPGGGDWSAYNRVVPFAHDYRQLPAGSCWWIKPRSGGPSNALIAKTHYPAKPADWGDAPWLPSAVLHLLQQPVPTCSGKSIGFLPLNIREATQDEVARRPELKGVPVIDRWAGIEYSVVPVPCNPEAEMLAVAKGVEAGIFDAAVAEIITRAMSAARDVEPVASTGALKELIVLQDDPQSNPPAPLEKASDETRAREEGERLAAVRAEAIDHAASAGFVRAGTIQAAIRQAIEEGRAQLPTLIRAELREAYARATGKA